MGKLGVIMLGNPIRRDDSVAVILGNRLGKGIEVLDGNIMATGLIDLISRYDTVIILDAIDFGGDTGDVKVFDLEEIKADSSSSTHSLNLREMIDISREVYGKPSCVKIIGIQPESLSFGIGLTESIRERMDEIVKKIDEIIRGYL